MWIELLPDFAAIADRNLGFLGLELVLEYCEVD
jgi:hypothetical protein